MNRQDIAHQVSLTLGDNADDFDIDGLVNEIIDTHGAVDIDTIDSEAYWKLVQRYDITI